MFVISIDSVPLPPPLPQSSSSPPPSSLIVVMVDPVAAVGYHSRESVVGGSDSSAPAVTVVDVRSSRGGDEDEHVDDDDVRSFRRRSPLTTLSASPPVKFACSSSYTVTATWSLSLSHSSTRDRFDLTNRSNMSTPVTSVCTAASTVLVTDDPCG